MPKLLIIGAGGHGKAVADAALESGLWQEICFLDDAWPNKAVNGIWNIVGNISQMADWATKCSAAVVALGNNHLRMELQQQLIDSGHSIASIIHPSAQVSRHTQIGAGSVVLANCVISVGVVIGKAAIINTAATIGHDSHLADAVHIAPGSHLGGDVSIGDFSWVGIGSVIRHGIRVGSNVVLTPGEVVTNNIDDHSMP
ncbi:MAG: acetyltransferase [Gallionella sp.]|nr:acetyltransferase [Gallionella sp.]